MIIAYHAIFTTYGTWLPNDPRGSYSRTIYNAELAELGRIRYGRQNPQPGRPEMRRFRTAAVPRLSRPPYYINATTRPIVADALGEVRNRLGLSISACAIMNDHVHLLLLRSKYRIEYLVNQFKGAATAALKLKKTPWTRRGWNMFINDEETLYAATEYIRGEPRSRGDEATALEFCDSLAAAGVGRRAGGR
jgi:hypothetical protein